jgi:hypothetical protein
LPSLQRFPSYSLDRACRRGRRGAIAQRKQQKRRTMSDISDPRLQPVEPQPSRPGRPGPANMLIVAAIRERRLVKLAYSAGNRIVEPHIYGVGGDGQELLRCYQVGGESLSHERYGWKLLRGEEIRNVEVLDVSFVPRAGYNPQDPAIRHVHASV